MDKRSSNTSDNGTIRVFFQKLILLALLPFIIALCSFTFWFLIQKIHKNDINAKRMLFIC